MEDPVKDNTVTTKPDVPKPSFIWLKDSSGYPSVTVTLLAVSFWVTTVIYILSAFKKIGPIEFQEFSVAATSSYFIPILSLYFGRKWTDAKIGINKFGVNNGNDPQ